MIEGTPCAALFWYVHRPMGQGHDGADGGFTVTLYENDTLTYTVFNALRQPVQQLAQRSVEILTACIEGQPSRHETVPFLLFQRESTRRLNT